MKLGKAFKMARTRSGMRQGELAEKLGVSPTYISMLENDRRDPSWSFVCSACDALEIPLPLLLLLAANTEGQVELSAGRSTIQRELMSMLSSLNNSPAHEKMPPNTKC